MCAFYDTLTIFFLYSLPRPYLYLLLFYIIFFSVVILFAYVEILFVLYSYLFGVFCFFKCIAVSKINIIVLGELFLYLFCTEKSSFIWVHTFCSDIRSE